MYIHFLTPCITYPFPSFNPQPVMCGICGVYSFSGFSQTPVPDLSAALTSLSKRGPEVQAHYHHGSVVLGHTRLSIIDTRPEANQPFSDESGDCALVFNGEIYNYRQLRERLKAKGIAFRTESDTEVLLQWIKLYGQEGIKDLQGFFAFAFYAKKDNSLLLVRDRFGIKPLLFCQQEGNVKFASEMKALLAMGIPKVLDRTSMQIYFQLNYIPAPWTIYEDVCSLLPGQYMLIKDGEVKTATWYEIPETAPSHYQNLSYTDAMGLLEQKLEESVVKRLVSDVPLGAFLSGGIDSSVIVALAAKHVDKLKTFSIGFKDEPMFDETRYARSVARMHNTDHTEFLLTTHDLLDCLYQVLDYTDQPFADSSALAVYILSRETRGEVTVALSGDGADEMLAGYNKHMAEWRAMQGGLSAQLLKNLYPVLGLLPQSRHSRLGNKIRQMHRFGKGVSLPAAQRYWRWASFAGEAYPDSLLLNPVSQDEYLERKSQLTKFVKEQGDINDVLRNDMHLVLPNDMLTKVDLMSMANSLEVRVPFLDHEVVNLLFSLPGHYKIDKYQRKKILKDTFRQMLPPELYHRPKQGFEVPLLSWFRSELKSSIMDNWLNEEYIKEQNIFNPAAIAELKSRLFSSRPGEVHAQVWSLIVFQHWYAKYHQ